MQAADAVFAAGWTDGHGCSGNTQVFQERGKGLARDGYAPLLKLLE